MVVSMFFTCIYHVIGLLLSSLFFFSSQLSAEISERQSIDIVYHIATLGNWEEIVHEQIDTLERSGLGDACDSLTVTIVGTEIEKVYQHFSNLNFYHKVKLIHASQNLHQYEFPGIEMVLQIAHNNPNARILYIHSKGVTHHGSSREQPSRFWRRYMEYFVIERWEDCIHALDEADVCGVDWTLSVSGLPFFAGNFWWGRGEYISTCQLNHNNRYDCEAFIGTGNQPIAKTFHQSGENPKLMNLYTYENFPHFFHFHPTVPYHRGIMNLYTFCYIDEYYRSNL